jgi:hypothetical protein
MNRLAMRDAMTERPEVSMIDRVKKARIGPLTAALAVLASCAHPLPGSVSSLRRRSVEGADAVDEIVALPTRGEVRQPFLLMGQAGARPAAVAVMFLGGNGVLGLPADISRLSFGPNFLVRTAELFRSSELAVALLDVPTDHTGGIDDEFRRSPAHHQDVAAVIGELRRRHPGTKVILVGTSRGTVSAAYLGVSLGRSVDGLVLASSVFAPGGGGPGLAGFDFGAIPAPLLLVHHERDQCPLCPYPLARALAQFPLVTVRGGWPARSRECGPLSAHGYYGQEPGTVAAIRSWILGRPFSTLVE